MLMSAIYSKLYAYFYIALCTENIEHFFSTVAIAFGRKLWVAKVLLLGKGGYTNEISIGRPINGLPNQKKSSNIARIEYPFVPWHTRSCIDHHCPCVHVMRLLERH